MEKILKNERVLLIAIPLGLFAVLLVLSSFTQKPDNKPIGTETFPTKKAIQSSTAPTMRVRQKNVEYNKSSVTKLIDKVKNPQPLVDEDYAIRQQLINSLKDNSGVLERTDAYLIEYVRSTDVFMVEITTINVGKAKKEATSWFVNKNLSDIAVCNLPIVFYLDGAISKQLKPLNMTFNPLPEGC